MADPYTVVERFCFCCGVPIAKRCGEKPSKFARRNHCSIRCRQRAGRMKGLQTEIDRHWQGAAIGEVPLTNGMTALVDPEDWTRTKQYIWWARPGNRSGSWYAVTRVSGKDVTLHFFVLANDPPELVDHWSGDGLDNRKQNLRSATPSQNTANRHLGKDNTSGYRGVLPHKRKWRAVIRSQGKTHHIGLWRTTCLTLRRPPTPIARSGGHPPSNAPSMPAS